jgi:glycosyltransferase involved in cell wall biosynthesis
MNEDSLLERKFDYDIAFICGLFPSEMESLIVDNSKGGIQVAANNLQWAYVLGFDSNLRRPIKLINSMYIGSFPYRYKQAVIPTIRFQHVQDADDVNVGFLNIPLLKHVSRLVNLKPYIKNWALTGNGRKKVVFAYAATSVMVKSLLYAKQCNPQITTVLIVPDLPEYMNPGREKSLYARVKSMFLTSFYDDIRKVDGFVYLSAHMSDKISSEKPFRVVEGISKAVRKANYEKYKEEERVFLYSGGIERAYGVLDLARAFSNINMTNIFLWICGDGSDEAEVRKLCSSDDRIKYYGRLPHEEVLVLQSKAHFLINPRLDNGEFTRYSFPSKNIEYLGSGSVTIAYMLPGIPMEYAEHIISISEGANGIENTLRYVLGLSEQELIDRAKRAKQFIDKNKNPWSQTRRVLEMLQDMGE